MLCCLLRQFSEMGICKRRCFSSAGGSHKKAFLNEEWFIYFFNGAGIFAHCRGYGAYSYRSAFEFVYYCSEYAVVHLVQTVLIYVQSFQAFFCYLEAYPSVGEDLGKVSHPPQQKVGYSRGASTASGNLHGCVLIYRCGKNGA